MQPWTAIHNARQAMLEAFEHDFIYDNTTTYLDALAEAHATLQDHFAQPPAERNYWTGRMACQEIVVRTAMIAQDGDHGIGEDNPTPSNPTALAFLNSVGHEATQYETVHPLYNHWDDYDRDLTLWQSTLHTEYAIPPDSRDRTAVLTTLQTIAARTCLFISRAAFTIGDRDPHTRENYATWKAIDGEWTLRDEHCHPGFSPVEPDFPPDKIDETLCIPCQEYAYRFRTPMTRTLAPPPFRPAAPYHALTNPNPSAGIVTAATVEHWPMLGALALLANLHRIPLAIADHGLTTEIRITLKRFNIRWINHPRPTIPNAMPPHHAIAPPNAFWKPYVCQCSPWQRSIWIDADALPLTNLRPALEPKTDAPQLTRNDRFSERSFDLYGPIHRTLFPTQPPPTRDNYATIVNTGVLAWTKGEPLLETWRLFCHQIMDNPAHHSAANCRDQSAMYLALTTLHNLTGQTPTYLPHSWNWPADGLPAKQAYRRKPLPIDPYKLLATAKRRHPETHVVHWLGLPKPNDLYTQEHRQCQNAPKNP